jgi:hypothetical protein
MCVSATYFLIGPSVDCFTSRIVDTSLHDRVGGAGKTGAEWEGAGVWLGSFGWNRNEKETHGF